MSSNTDGSQLMRQLYRTTARRIEHTNNFLMQQSEEVYNLTTQLRNEAVEAGEIDH